MNDHRQRFHIHCVSALPLHDRYDRTDNTERLLVHSSPMNLLRFILLLQADLPAGCCGQATASWPSCARVAQGISSGALATMIPSRCPSISILFHADRGTPMNSFLGASITLHGHPCCSARAGIVVPDVLQSSYSLSSVVTSTSTAARRITSPSSASGSLTSTFAFAIKTHRISPPYLIRVILCGSVGNQSDDAGKLTILTNLPPVIVTGDDNY